MPLHRLVVRVWPLFFVLVLTPMAVLAQNQPPPPAVQKEQLLKPAQLDALVANIALYPDNVLSFGLDGFDLSTGCRDGRSLGERE